MIIKMIWLNLWRNRRRTLITMASLMFAVVLSVSARSWQNGVFDNLIKNVVSFYSGYIQIHKKGYWEERVLDNTFAQTDSLDKAIKSLAFVQITVPRIESFTLATAGNATYGCMVVGTVPDKEDALTHIKSKVIKGNYYSKNDSTALIGEGLAEKLKIGVNDTIVLLGQGYQGSIAAGKFRVQGILRFGSPQLNETSVYLPLSVAQEWLGAYGLVTSISLGLSDAQNLDQKNANIKALLSDDYEVMTWKEMMPEIESHIRADGASFYIIIGILYMIIAFGIFGTILMMTNERTYEFGMLIAIGMKKRRIAWMLIGESFLISILGTLIGIAVALPIVLYFQKYPIRLGGESAKVYEQFGFEAVFPTIVESETFITQAWIVVVISLIVGLYPLWFISRLDVVKAMRR